MSNATPTGAAPMTADRARALAARVDPLPICDACGAEDPPVESVTSEDGVVLYHRDCPRREEHRARIVRRVEANDWNAALEAIIRLTAENAALRDSARTAALPPFTAKESDGWRTLIADTRKAHAEFDALQAAPVETNADGLPMPRSAWIDGMDLGAHDAKVALPLCDAVERLLGELAKVTTDRDTMATERHRFIVANADVGLLNVGLQFRAMRLDETLAAVVTRLREAEVACDLAPGWARTLADTLTAAMAEDAEDAKGETRSALAWLAFRTTLDGATSEGRLAEGLGLDLVRVRELVDAGASVGDAQAKTRNMLHSVRLMLDKGEAR